MLLKFVFGSNKIYIKSKRITKILLQTSVLQWIYVILPFQADIVIFLVPSLDCQWSLKPLSLIDRSLRNNFLLKKHWSLKHNQFFTFLSLRTLRGSPSRVKILDSTFHILFFRFRLLVNILLSGGLEVMMTIFSF